MKAYAHIETAERAGESYQFDELMVVKSLETGEYFYATDSGCSCPCPFEDIAFPTDYTPIQNTEEGRRVFVIAFETWARGGNALDPVEVNRITERITGIMTGKVSP